MKGSSNTEASKVPLKLEVFNGGQADFYANQTLVMGERDAVLIDVPFTRSQAHRIVAGILDLGRHLTHIYITHSHPDHYFSAPVLLSAFPNAELIAVPKVCLNIGMSIPGRLKAWAGMLGVNGPGNVVAPKPYDETFIALEGERLEILGPMAGDHQDSTAIYIPSIDAIVTGDVAFNGFHLFLTHGKEDYRKEWLKSLEYLMSLKPKTVIAGHRAPGLSASPASLQYSRDYLRAFEKAVSNSSTSEEITAEMKKNYPKAQDIMEDFVLSASAQVAAGEMDPILETD